MPPALIFCATVASRTPNEKCEVRLHAVCRRLNVALCGGHSEITDAVTRPVMVGCLLGECAPDRVITAAGARVGDALLLTKGLAIEAVSILAREQAQVIQRRYGARFLARCGQERFLLHAQTEQLPAPCRAVENNLALYGLAGRRGGGRG